jgi:hypothetical protein
MYGFSYFTELCYGSCALAVIRYCDTKIYICFIVCYTYICKNIMWVIISLCNPCVDSD